jgi:hypothetical protein
MPCRELLPKLACTLVISVTAFLSACGGDDSDGGSGNGSTVGPVCTLEIKSVLKNGDDVLTGKPLAQYSAIVTTDDGNTAYGLSFASDANGDGNVDVGDKLTASSVAETVDDFVKDQTKIGLIFLYEAPGSETSNFLWSGDCEDGKTAAVAQ